MVTQNCFKRIDNEPLLDLSAVPWAEPRKVIKGHCNTTEEVRRTIMHPCVVEAGALLPSPPARWIMYYAPHHSAGIGAALAEEIIGPWQPMEGNPILTLDRVEALQGHLSAPDVIWMPQQKTLRMYCHGGGTEGQQTAAADSTDGLEFEPISDRPVLGGPYLRVWRRNGLFYGVYHTGPDLCLVRSEDGIEWEGWPGNPLLQLREEDGEFDRLRHHCVWPVEETLHLYYCTYRDPGREVEAIRLATLQTAGPWEEWPRPQRRGDVLRPELPWEQGNLRDPYLVETEGSVYMFYVGGNESGIGLAVATG